MTTTINQPRLPITLETSRPRRAGWTVHHTGVALLVAALLTIVLAERFERAESAIVALEARVLILEQQLEAEQAYTRKLDAAVEQRMEHLLAQRVVAVVQPHFAPVAGGGFQVEWLPEEEPQP